MKNTKNNRTVARRAFMSLTLAAGMPLGFAAGIAAVSGTTSTASAQVSFDNISSVTTGHPQRDSLLRMLKPITIQFEDQPLEAIIDFIAQYTGAEIRTFWGDDSGAREGLDPEERISVSVTEVTSLDLLEMVLEQAVGDFGDIDDNTWQMNRLGTMQIGPKSRLNNYKRTGLYDINDLLLDIPDYDNAPEFDISQASQQGGGGGGGGGGGQGPFQNNNNNNNQDDDQVLSIDERADALIELIQNTTEINNWDTIAPNGATLRFYQGNFIMTGSDYMHRALNGYDWWPEEATDFAGVASGGQISFFLPEDVQHRLGYDIAPERIVFTAPARSASPTATGGRIGG